VEFLAWLYNDSPVKDDVVVNDRWGDDTRGKHGGYYNYDDRYNPGVLQPHKWENAMTIDKESWGYRRNMRIEDCLTPEQLLTQLVETVSCGGNILVNVGPTKEGTIIPIQQERLLQMGEWLGINGEAIYKTVPWTLQNDTVTSGVWFTADAEPPRTRKIYAMVTRGWPGSQVLLGGVSPVSLMTIQMLGTPGYLNWVPATPSGILVTLPPLTETTSKWVWTLVINLP